MLKLNRFVALNSNISYLLAKRMASNNSRPFENVTVFGSGLMGSGIAQVTAEAGYQVTLIDQSDKILQKAQASIKTSLQRSSKKKFEKAPDAAAQIEKHVSSVLERIKLSTNVETSVTKADLVIEAIVENMNVKHELFSKLDSLAPKHALFASNTSSLPIGEIASVTKRKDKFGGLHFFNPVPVMKLLEVVRIAETSDDTHKKFIDYGKSIGKVTVNCKDTPGFIVNRLLVPYLFEAVRMYERGDASTQDIDIAMKLGAGYPMGPFELADYVGLDTSKFVMDGWQKKYPNESLFRASEMLNKLVKEGKLGRKSGEGFYKYTK